jgi:hypothetical protein
MKPRLCFAADMIEAKRIGDAAFAKPSKMPPDHGIGGNTFRAFQRAGLQPSKLFQTWVADSATAILKEKQRDACRQGFLDLHAKLSDSWRSYWNEHAKREIKTSEKYKVVDLYIKALAKHTDHDFENLRPFFYQFGNVPLDRFSLLLIREEFLGVILSKNPSMGDVADDETYHYLQDELFRHTSSAKVPNLAFDIYAWDLKGKTGPTSRHSATPL